MLEPAQVADLLTTLAAADNLHSTPSQEKFAIKVDTWQGILGDVPFEACMQAINQHYRDPNAKSLSAGRLRQMALQLVPAAPRPMSGAPDDVARRERACNSPACRCTHLECFNGFLDEETTIERNGRTYPAVKRCPTCQSALEARTGVAV